MKSTLCNIILYKTDDDNFSSTEFANSFTFSQNHMLVVIKLNFD